MHKCNATMPWFANIAKKYLLQKHYSRIKTKIVDVFCYSKAFQKFKLTELRLKTKLDLLLKASSLNNMFHTSILH